MRCCIMCQKLFDVRMELLLRFKSRKKRNLFLKLDFWSLNLTITIPPSNHSSYYENFHTNNSNKVLILILFVNHQLFMLHTWLNNRILEDVTIKQWWLEHEIPGQKVVAIVANRVMLLCYFAKCDQIINKF